MKSWSAKEHPLERDCDWLLNRAALRAEPRAAIRGFVSIPTPMHRVWSSALTRSRNEGVLNR